MKYTLITAQGKIYTFYILETAKVYQDAYGGTIVSATEEKLVPTLVPVYMQAS